MDCNAKPPLQWDWSSVALFQAKEADDPKQKLAQPTGWGIENGTICSSSGGGVCSRFDVGNGCSSKSSISASVDSAVRAAPRAMVINFEAVPKDYPTNRKDLGGEVEHTETSAELVASVGSAEPLIGLKLGKRTYFEDVCTENHGKNVTFPAIPAPSSTTVTVKKSRVSHQSMQNSPCQVEGCNADLTSAKDYHRKHRVCESHSKCPKVIVAGQERRFCQQCSRFHDLSEFDQKKRSCRRRLSDHNARRRKPPADTIPFNSARLSSSFYGLEASAFPSNLDGAVDLRRALSLLSTHSWGSAEPGPPPINQLVHVNQPSAAQTAVHVVHTSSNYWQAEQSLHQEPRILPFNSHSNESQFPEIHLLKAPYENTFFDTNHLD